MEVEFWLAERDGTRVSPLPDANFDFIEWELNGPGSLSLNIDPLSENANRIEGAGVTEIQAWIDGVLRWWGPVWGLSGSDPTTINVTAEGLLSYMKHRYIDRTTLTYDTIDQFQIAANVIIYAQDESFQANRDLNIDFAAFTISGVPRSREYKLDDHQMLLDILNEFDERTLANGFDWDIDISQGGGSRFWTPYYPKIGSTKTDYAILWTPNGEQRNVSTFGWTEDFQDLGTDVIVTGGTVSTDSETFRKTGRFEDTGASAYFGVMQKIVSESDELDQTWLDNRAQQEVAKSALPTTTTQITGVKGAPIDSFGNVFVGDYVPTVIDHGRIQVAALYRIEKIRLHADETIDYTYGEMVDLP